ncbi:MAG: type II secretion system protein [Candidatus Omnitrophota bacterium]
MRIFSKRSLTLVEVVVAMVILVSVIAGLLATFTAGKRFALHAKYRLQAINIARGVLESLKDQVRADTWNTGGLRVMDDVVLPAEREGIINYSKSYRVENVDNSTCRKVTVTVRWTPPR